MKEGSFTIKLVKSGRTEIILIIWSRWSSYMWPATIFNCYPFTVVSITRTLWGYSLFLIYTDLITISSKTILLVLIDNHLLSTYHQGNLFQGSRRKILHLYMGNSFSNFQEISVTLTTSGDFTDILGEEERQEPLLASFLTLPYPFFHFISILKRYGLVTSYGVSFVLQ